MRVVQGIWAHGALCQPINDSTTMGPAAIKISRQLGCFMPLSPHEII